MNKDIHKPMQHIIKDSDLILEKLDELHYDKVTKVVSPFAKANLIIINPSALMDLFLLLRISPPQQNFDLLGLLKFLNKIVSRQSINSLSIYSEGVLHYSGHSRKSLARYLLEYYYELKSKNMGIEFLKQIKKLIISLFKNNYLEKSTIQVIYQQVIKEYYNGNILKETIEDTLDMLHELLITSEVVPQSYFYFNYYESGLGYIADNKRSLKWSFNNGLSIALWFYMEALDTYESNFPSLFLIHCFQKGGGGVEAYFKGRKLFYRLLTINYEKASNKTDGIELGEFSPNTWYFLAIEHEKLQGFVFGSGQITVYINNDTPKIFSYDYLKMDPGKSITTLTFGVNFVGKMTSIFLFQTINKKKLSDLSLKFPLGIYNNSLLEALKKIFEINKMKPVLMYLPNRINDNIIIDLIDQFNGKFFKNTGFLSKEQSRLKMSYFGGMSGMLPYFYFLRYLNDEESAHEIYNKLLRILMVLFSISNENQKEAGETNLFRIIGMLLAETPFKLISHTNMETLAEMRHVIKDNRLFNQFFLEIIWNVTLITRIDDSNLSNDYYKFIRILYVENPLLFSNLLSIPALLRISIYKFDAKNMECCLAHCLNIGLIKPNNEILKEFKWEADKVLSPLIRIVELIMNHEIIHEETACIIFKNIIEMLIIKSSPCFQLNLLKLIKHLLIDEFCIHINSDVFSKTIIESKLLYLLLYTIGNSLCPDIKSYCIKIINFMIKKQLIFYENYSSKEISNYLSLILWNLTPNSYKKIKLLLDSSNNTSNSFSANVEDDFRENSKNNDFNLNFKTNSNNLSLKEGSFYKKEIVLKSLKGEKMQSISDTLRESDNYSTNIKIEAKELDPKLLMKSEDFNNNIKDVQLISQPLKQSESLIIEKIKENPLITQFYPKSIFSNIEKIEYNKFSHIKDDSFNDEKIEDMHLIPQSLIKADYFNNEKSSDVSQNIDLDEIQWDYEPLYNSIMEWLLGRKPANLESDLLIDDIDQINNPEILILVLDFYKKSPTCLKAKIIQDFYMLIKWNKKNIQIYLEEREFIAWILDILLEQQSLMKEGERSPFDAAIWDIGNKIIVLLMKYVVESSYIDAHEKLYYILQYIQLKSYYTNNKTANMKDKNIAISAKFLLRHIWNGLLESLSDSVHSCKSLLSNTLWKNLSYLIYFTQEIVSSIYNPQPLSPGFKQKCVEIYPSLNKCVTEINEKEKIPTNFESIMKEYQNIDYKLIENLFNLLDPVWLENDLNIPTSLLLTSEVEILENKITNLMDFKHSYNYSQKLEFLIFEPFLTDPNINRTKGPILKLILLLLTLMIDFSLISNNRDRLIFWLEKLKLIFKSLLLMGENARSKPFPLSRHQEKTLISNLLYILRYLYLINDKKKKNKTINELFIKVIKDLDLFIIFMIDHMNERYSGFSSIPKDFKTSLTSSSNPTIPPYNFLLYEIFNNILVGVNGSKIISIPEIKILKAEDLSDLHNVVLSDNWIYAFTDNQLIISVVSEGFNESLYLKLFNAHQIANENRDSRNKCLILMEERNKRLKVRIENEVYELILWILETNEEKKNCDWYNLEKRRRKAKHEWKKIWRHLRINENIWQPDDLKAQNDNYFLSKDYSFDNLRPNKYFYFEMWKYEIKNKSRPYLKMKLKEPIPQIKIQIFEKTGLSDNILNYQQIFNLIHQNFYVKSQYLTDSLNKIEKSPQKIAGNILNLGEKALNTIKSIVANKQKNSPLLKPNTQNAELLFQRKCQWISILQLKTGIFTLTPIKMIFHHDCLLQKNTHHSILSYKLSSHTPFYKEWLLSELKEILPHRFILRKSALNFIFNDGTSLILNFPDTDPNIVLQRIVSFTKNESFFSLNSHLLNLTKTTHFIEKSKIFKKWLNYEIDNFEYLMHLNSLAGRSYYDITQYPVFPWIINVYAMRELPLHVLSPEIIFRNLVKTMGSLGDQERIKTFRERYEHTDDFDPVPNYHFGSHYSSPAIIMQYLIRLAPYSEGHKELQGGKFDLADRLFFSLQESFKGATEEISDVRELIPEFFYCPEFLLNLENSNFGVQQTGNRVHNVKLPLWSYKPLDNSNPYNFIKMHREFLEGEYVSENINNWIDLIFGYKQRGREAVNNLNTFFYLTYEDGIDLEKLENERFRVCYESQIIHFGQTPKQIFLKPHPSRPSLYEFNKKGRILTDPEYQIKSYKYSLDKKKGNNEGNETIIFIKFISENKIGVIKKNGAVYYYEWADSATWIQEKITPFRITPEKEVQANFDQREFEGAQCFLINHVKVGFLKDGKVIVTGGYMNGCLKLFSFEFNEEMPVKYNYHQDAITVLEIDFKERFLITGCKSGECIYWKINSGHKLKPKYMYYDHEGEILSLHISNDMKAFITGGIDQKIFIYNQINGKILKSLLHPDQHPVNNICLSSTPLAISIFYSVQNQMLYSYSINGQLMEKVKEDALVISNLEICKSLDGLDVLVYTTNKGEIVLRNLPYLEIRKKQSFPGNSITAMTISKNRKYLLIGNSEGEINVLADSSSTQKYVFSSEEI